MSVLDEYSSCLAYLEDHQQNSQVLIDFFRANGSALTFVKELRKKFQGSISGSLDQLTNDVGDVVGLFMVNLREEPCIPLSSQNCRESFIQIALEAFRLLDEKNNKDINKGTSSSSSKSIPEEDEQEDDENEVEKTKIRSQDDDDDSDDDNIEDDDDESSSSSQSRKEMNRAIAARNFVNLEKIATFLLQVDKPIRDRIQRLVQLLYKISENSEDDCYLLAEIFGPMFARPDNTAYLSIRHSKDMPNIRLILWVFIESYPDIIQLVNSGGKKSGNNTLTPPPSSNTKHLLHSIKPRLSSVSSIGGATFSPPTTHPTVNAFATGEGEFFRVLSLSPGGGNNNTLLHHPHHNRGYSSPSSSGHSRKKTPPRISDLMQKRKIDVEHLESLISNAVNLIFGVFDDLIMEDDNHKTSEIWIAEESGAEIPIYNTNILPEMMTISVKKSVWATKERVSIEKRVLKKRLLHWDKEFEVKFGRKPTRDDRIEMRSVFAAYGALKSLLTVLEGSNNNGEQQQTNNLLLLEKRALQAVLKLFEKDFEERMGRKVEFAADIVGRELEYSRYKELKETAF